VFDYLRSFIRDKWSTNTRTASYVRASEVSGSRYRVTIIHAEDEYDIPWRHTPVVFWHAISGTLLDGLDGYEYVHQMKSKIRKDLGAAGSVVEWKTEHGIIREEILKHGLHDLVMGSRAPQSCHLQLCVSLAEDAAILEVSACIYSHIIHFPLPAMDHESQT